MTLDVIEWDHPHRGRIHEVVCRKHESDLLAALKLLGMGCIGWQRTGPDSCTRCAHGTTLPREWLGQ